MFDLADTAARLTAAAARVAGCVSGTRVDGLDDEALTTLLADATTARDAIDVVIATASTVIDARSSRDRAPEGLAQRHGHPTGVSLVQSITGQSRADITRALRTGSDLLDPPAPTGTDAPDTVVDAMPRWRALLRDAVTTGRVSSAQYRAIRTGLGEPPVEHYPDLHPEFLPGAWATAVEILLAAAPDVPVEALAADARIARDRLDPIGTTRRFEERFAARSFRTWTDDHGQRHARIAFDDDAAAWVSTILSAALRPRRGPRFVDSEMKREVAADTANDERTTEQLQYDTIMAVLRVGGAADPRQAFGDRQPGVRIIVDESAITAADTRRETAVTGVGHLEDGGQALPGSVVETYLCDAGSLPVHLDEHGRPLDVGRTSRLFTKKQRVAIAVRDGGCIGVHCHAPPSWTEVHHIDHWWEHHGRTDIDDGVSLCRRCHLGLHNRNHRIRRERDPITGDDTYWLHSPPDPVTGISAAPVPLRTRTPRRYAALA